MRVEKLRIAVCDDEAFALDVIREAIDKVLQEKKEIGRASCRERV